MAIGPTTVTDLGNGNILCSTADSVPGKYFNTVRVDVAAFAGGSGSPGLSAGPRNAANITGALSKLVSVINQVGFNASIDASNNIVVLSGNTVDTTIGSQGNHVLGLATSTATSFGVGSEYNGIVSSEQVQLPSSLTATSAALGLTGLTVGSPNAIATVDAAIAQLGTISSTLGSASQELSGLSNFSSSLLSSKTAGVGALTDADMAEVSARLASLQTKQQLSVQALSIANRQPQALLKLFGGQ